jgi:hypothetical protein
MKSGTRQKNFLAMVLSSVAVLLGGVLIWEWDQGMRLEQDLLKIRKIPVTPVPMKAILPEFNLPDAESGFPELISRSLFSVSRRSSASAAKGGSGAMKKGQFVLVGVLITPTQKSALLRDVQTNKTETIALVGVVRGLTLGEVEPSRVVLRQGAESEELILNVQTGPKGLVVPQTPAAPVPAAAKPPPPPASAASAPASPPASAPSAPIKPVEVASAPKIPPPQHGGAKK